MEENITEENAEKKKIKPIPIIISLIVIGIIIFGILKYNDYRAKNHVMEIATENLIKQGYDVLNLTVVESEAATQNRTGTGKVTFAVKNNKGDTMVGNASVNNERSFLFFNKSVFVIDMIGKK